MSPATDPTHDPDLWAAIDNDDAATLNACLRARRNAVQDRDDQKRTPLIRAADTAATRCIGLLIRQGADLHPIDRFGRTPAGAAIAEHQGTGVLDSLVATGLKYTPEIKTVVNETAWRRSPSQVRRVMGRFPLTAIMDPRTGERSTNTAQLRHVMDRIGQAPLGADSMNAIKACMLELAVLADDKDAFDILIADGARAGARTRHRLIENGIQHGADGEMIDRVITTHPDLATVNAASGTRRPTNKDVGTALQYWPLETLKTDFLDRFGITADIIFNGAGPARGLVIQENFTPYQMLMHTYEATADAQHDTIKHFRERIATVLRSINPGRPEFLEEMYLTAAKIPDNGRAMRLQARLGYLPDRAQIPGLMERVIVSGCPGNVEAMLDHGFDPLVSLNSGQITAEKKEDVSAFIDEKAPDDESAKVIKEAMTRYLETAAPGSSSLTNRSQKGDIDEYPGLAPGRF